MRVLTWRLRAGSLVPWPFGSVLPHPWRRLNEDLAWLRSLDADFDAVCLRSVYAHSSLCALQGHFGRQRYATFLSGQARPWLAGIVAVLLLVGAVTYAVRLAWSRLGVVMSGSIISDAVFVGLMLSAADTTCMSYFSGENRGGGLVAVSPRFQVVSVRNVVVPVGLRQWGPQPDMLQVLLLESRGVRFRIGHLSSDDATAIRWAETFLRALPEPAYQTLLADGDGEVRSLGVGAGKSVLLRLEERGTSALHAPRLVTI
jgi:hypothetical protein